MSGRQTSQKRQTPKEEAEQEHYEENDVIRIPRGITRAEGLVG